MEIKTNLCSNAIRKIALLITRAADLGMNIDGYGFADENKHSGNVYLWLEDYNFTLYIALCSDSINALWTNPNDGEEETIDTYGMSLYEIESWANDLNDANA